MENKDQKSDSMFNQFIETIIELIEEVELQSQIESPNKASSLENV